MQPLEGFDIKNYYSYDQAVLVLNANRHTVKPVDPKYIHSLVRLGKVRIHKVGRSSLYLREDVDKYIVEDVGVKSGRAKQEEALKKSGRPRRKRRSNLDNEKTENSSGFPLAV